MTNWKYWYRIHHRKPLQRPCLHLMHYVKKFISLVISVDGISPDVDKVATMVKMVAPSYVIEVRCLLDIVN